VGCLEHDDATVVDVGIPDRESWLLREAYPTGTARGWRRAGCLAAIAVTLAALVAAVVVVLIVGLR